MSPANKEATLIGVASTFLLLGVFSKPLGIPEDWSPLLFIPAGICFFWIYWAKRNRKGGTPEPRLLASRDVLKKRFWAIAASLIIGSIGFLFVMPYTVENFQPWLYYFVVPAQIVFITIILVILWRKLFGPASAPK